MGNKFTGDFETTVDFEDCRVWAWAMSEIGNPDNFIYGNDMDSFMDYCLCAKKNLKIWFHNLKFDGSFIISWLLTMGFEYVEDKKDRATGTFTTLITDMGQFYSIEVWFRVSGKKCKKVTFYDSLKILNFSVAQIAEDFDLPIKKLTLDYKAKREIGHNLTTEEIDYIRNDVEIMSRALKIMFDAELTKMTIGSDALSNFKSMCPNFRNYFPVLNKDLDREIRESYKGGFTYVNPVHKGEIVDKGIVFDVNSLYPSRMEFEWLPISEPETFEGEYQEDSLYPLYVINITCAFELKEGKIPSIQIKNSFAFMPTEYLESSNGELVDLTLTKPDYELFKEQYNIYNLTVHGGWKFKALKGLFNQYIEYWTEQKIQAKKDKNSSMYRIAKLMLNSLYGKLALNPVGAKKNPYLDEDGVVRFEITPPEEREPIYIPAGSFITATARCYTIRFSQTVRDWSLKKYGEDFYLYSDTDSVHMLVNNEEEDVKDLAKLVDIDDYRLGAWKLESRFKRGKFIRAKTYIEEDYDDHINTTIAGFPKCLAPLINFDNFEVGFTTEGLTMDDIIKIAKENGATDSDIELMHPKLSYHYVRGGVILEETKFEIKDK